MNNQSDGFKLEDILVKAADTTTKGTITVRMVSLPYRVFKSLLVAVVWALITFVNLMTPLLHFVTVPLSLAAALYFTIKTFQITKKISGGSGICPHCGEQFETMTGSYKFPIRDTCTACHRSVLLLKAS